MPSLNLDLDFETNPKILRLCSRLGLGDGGYMVPIRLWSYAGKHHPETGTFVGYSVDEIEKIVGWHGKPGQCLDALCDVGLLDRVRATRRSASRYAQPCTTRVLQRATKKHQKHLESYQIHDWLEHAGHIVHYKQRGRTAAAARWAKKSPVSNTDATSIATSIPQAMPEHYRAFQSRTKQNKVRIRRGCVRLFRTQTRKRRNRRCASPVKWRKGS